MRLTFTAILFSLSLFFSVRDHPPLITGTKADASTQTHTLPHFHSLRRWRAVFPASVRSRRRFATSGIVEYYVRWSLVVVLVYYTPRIQITTILEQYRSLSLSYRRRLLVPCGDVDWLSSWIGLQRCPCHGTLLFYVGNNNLIYSYGHEESTLTRS